MVRPVNLHGRPLDRCTIFGSVPQRNARIMNPKNPGFGFDLVYPLGVWILQIANP